MKTDLGAFENLIKVGRVRLFQIRLQFELHIGMELSHLFKDIKHPKGWLLEGTLSSIRKYQLVKPMKKVR